MADKLEFEEGHNPGAAFWIMPVRIPTSDERKAFKSPYQRIVECLEEEISIDEDTVAALLAYFLKKYYDKSLSMRYRLFEVDYNYDSIDNEDFEWYLTYNVYHYTTVKQMLTNIRHASDMLQHDFDNPSLDELKKCFWNLNYLDENDYRVFFTTGQRSDKSPIDYAKENLSSITDFYRSFIERMDLMMERQPDFKDISFMGP